MKSLVVALRALALTACLLTVAAACSSARSAAPSTTPASKSTATSTTDINETANSIPYNVGERIGLPNGWLVQIVKVRRPYANPRLPELPRAGSTSRSTWR